MAYVILRYLSYAMKFIYQSHNEKPPSKSAPPCFIILIPSQVDMKNYKCCILVRSLSWLTVPVPLQWVLEILHPLEYSPKLKIMRKLITPLQYWLYLKFNYPLFLWIWFSRDYVGEIYRHIFSWFEFVTAPGKEASTTHSSSLTKDFIANKNSQKKSFA